MTQTLNETAAVERHSDARGLDLANAGAGLAAAADASIAVAWAQKYAVVYRVVDQIVDTPLFPVGFWPLPIGVKPWDFRAPWLMHPSETPEDYAHRRRIAAAGGTTAALWGEGYGWSPPQSWRLIYVANGKASLYAEGVLALLRGAGFGVEKLERSETRAALRIRRPGAEWQEYEFTWADAVRAGYVPREGPNKGKDKGGNEKYHTDPKTMLWARVVTTSGRIEAPDVLAGMPVAELVDDEPLEPARGVTVSASAHDPAPAERPGSSSAILRAALETTDGIVTGPPEAVADMDRRLEDFGTRQAEASPPIEQTDWRRLMARFNELGVTGLGQSARRLQVMSRIAGRGITRGTDLTKDDAALILDNLAGDGGSRVVAQALEPDPDSERRVGDQDSDPSIDAGDADPDSDADDVPEPAPDEGRPAALEGVADPWANPGTQQ